MNHQSFAQLNQISPPQAASRSCTSGLLQRKCACGGTPGLDGECTECRQKRLQRQPAGQAEPTSVPPIVPEVLRSSGQPLDPATRAFMELRFSHDFSRVRVHTDTRSAESAREVSALAYTVGRDVVFGSGQYRPNTDSGRKLLAHELTHVVQQRSASLPATLSFGSPAGSAEREAARVGLGGQTPVTERTAPVLARQVGPVSGGLTVGPDPRSLSANLNIKALTDEAILAEIELMRGWLERQTSSNPGAEKILGVLGELGRELLRRHPDILQRVQDSLNQQASGDVSLSLLAPVGLTEAKEAIKVADAALNSSMRVGTTGAVEATGATAAAGVSAVGLGLWAFLIFIFFAPRGEYIEPETQVRIVEALNYSLTLAAAKKKPQTSPAPKPAPGPATGPTPATAPQTCTNQAAWLSSNTGCNFQGLIPEQFDPLAQATAQKNPQAKEYCGSFTGNDPCEYWLYPPGGRPGLVQEWARFDGYRGDSLIECKCGYEGFLGDLNGSDPIKRSIAKSVLDKMIKEILNHQRRAQDCGVSYQMIVSSGRLANFLRENGLQSLKLRVEPSELCD